MNASLMETSISATAATNGTDSGAVQVLQESIAFAVAFSFRGVPALINSSASLGFDVETRPPNLSLQLSVSIVQLECPQTAPINDTVGSFVKERQPKD